ncbi:MAG: hypothetical protein AB7F43_12370 [Bacteriovoracia bacterium]
MANRSVPKSLRMWFVIHFLADIAFAIPLILVPVETLRIFGWTTIDPLATRLVGAALVGIGVESLLGRNASIESFQTMLRLKILWSVSANIGIALTILQGAPRAAWIFQGIFVSFSALWIFYKYQLGKIGR